MKPITEKLTDIVGTAFDSCGLPREMGFVRLSDRPDMAQFQCNGAMAAAKAAKKNPREVAQAVVNALTPSLSLKGEGGGRNEAGEGKIFSKLEIAGPGFININITDEYLAAHMAETAADDHLGVTSVSPDTVVLDYGGPNIAKPMHVAHFRTAVIGDSLRRIVKFAGYKTLGDVHIGDWGTQMGMIIGEYVHSGRKQEVLSVNLADSVAVGKLMDDLKEIYPRVSGLCKTDTDRHALALADTLRIQKKEEPYFSLWQKIREASIIGMKKNYERLDVHFDLWKGEADVNDLIPAMVDDLKKNKFAVDDDGAVTVPVKRNDDKKEFPPLILYKRDGAVMYGTTDLATILERMSDYKPVKIIYVVDQRQHLHFEQVFRAARLSGIAPESTELTHAGFGTINGPDGKPFKTRAGGIMDLEDLISMAEGKARERLAEADLAQDMADNEKEDVVHKVAVAAIRFADLQNTRTADYVFDLDRLTSFEGKTGPYLLYQAVRIKSLLRKADYSINQSTKQLIIHDEDRPLALLLTQFPDAFSAALDNYAPHHLCDYAYKLAQEFSRFYSSCHILSEENESLKTSRLALCALTVRTMETALGLLGISVPERM